MTVLAQGHPLGGIEGFFIVFCVAPVWLMVFSCMIASHFIARSKGYAPHYWFFALHPIGLVIIANLAPLSTAESPEVRERMEARAEMTGTILSLIALLISIPWFWFVLWVVG